MKIVYLILFHQNEDQLFRLIERLDEAHVFFVVHVCKNYKKFSSLSKRAEGTANLAFCRRERGTWASYGLAKATFNGIEEALIRVDQIGHLILLSAQDYPLCSNAKILDFLSMNSASGFIAYSACEPELNENGEYYNPIKSRWSIHDERSRYTFYNLKVCANTYVRLHDEMNPEKGIVSRVQNSLRRLISSSIPKREFLPGLVPYFGPQWFVITGGMCRYIVDNFRSDSLYHRYMKRVFCPDEMFFHTILLNSEYREKISNRCLHFTRWSSYEHPDTFVEKDLGLILKNRENFLFARKFDVTKGSRVLDLIDEILS